MELVSVRACRVRVRPVPSARADSRIHKAVHATGLRPQATPRLRPPLGCALCLASRPLSRVSFPDCNLREFRRQKNFGRRSIPPKSVRHASRSFALTNLYFPLRSRIMKFAPSPRSTALCRLRPFRRLTLLLQQLVASELTAVEYHCV